VVRLGAESAVQVPAIALSESSITLDELIVTGTAAPTSRRAIGTAVSTVDAQQIEDSPGADDRPGAAGEGLRRGHHQQHRHPGGGVSVRLRGTSSITGGAEPLYIVDGVIIDNNADQQINLGYRSNPRTAWPTSIPTTSSASRSSRAPRPPRCTARAPTTGWCRSSPSAARAGAAVHGSSRASSRSDLVARIDFALTPLEPRRHRGATRYDHQDLRVPQRHADGPDHVSASGGAEDTRYFLSANYNAGRHHARLGARQAERTHEPGPGLRERFSVAAGANYIRSNTDLVVSGEQGEGGLLTADRLHAHDRRPDGAQPGDGRVPERRRRRPEPARRCSRTGTSSRQVDRFVGSFQARANPVRRPHPGVPARLRHVQRWRRAVHPPHAGRRGPTRAPSRRTASATG
jgi:TonB-dependent starch-binding outer membrane protein SusC